MDGAARRGGQDLGGVAGFGAVVAEPNEPVFHADWERRAFALTLAMARPGAWNIDMSRDARENRPPADYLAMSYYQIWLAGLERLMQDRSLVTREEIEAGHALTPATPQLPVLTRDEVPAMLGRGGPANRPATVLPRFRIGDRVRARDATVATHTRLPRSVRGHVGVIERVHGCHVFPDSNASGAGEQPQWLYTVAFDGREVWGEKANANTIVSVDAWDSYLEPQ
jgi:nitrile hydratase